MFNIALRQRISNRKDCGAKNNVETAKNSNKHLLPIIKLYVLFVYVCSFEQSILVSNNYYSSS